ncbi:hypothetical protein TrVE_jg7877 [Triparma verrucosa]|uniref:Uncharacterized protein n=1 Tax=Triparma verrucosa TaxID=1606542 RepID=A0A9W7BEV1_9STRA|nr:hypothetical protein TrVE_jg7877 [Triparma verrucosa]
MTLSLIGTTIGASIFAPTTALALDADTEASMRRIAEKSEAANALEREKDKARAAKQEKDKEGGSTLVIGVAGGGLALSIPFFLPNLIRLGKKLSGGGGQ